MNHQTARVFNIGPDKPFLETLARALTARAIIPGFPDPTKLLSLASATIFVPTIRAAEALAAEFARANPNGAAVLPRIVPLGAIEDPETASFDAAGDMADGPENVVSSFERRMILTQLVRQWALALRASTLAESDAIVPTSREPDAALVGASWAAAWSMARELGDLMDEFAIEGVSWAALDKVVPDDLDEYWLATRKFLAIASSEWPKILEARGLIDRVHARARRLERAIAAFEAKQMPGPMIVAGSTGTNAGTRRLLASLAHHPQGAVVLAGLDRTLDEAPWRMLTADGDASAGHPTHPQSALARLLSGLGLARQQVRDIDGAPAAVSSRSWLISQALRPSETTDAWRAFAAPEFAPAFEEACDGLSVVQCPDERAEAFAIAIRMRQAVAEGKRAALVTPDRNIARRVRAQMARWNIDIEDSAGEPLSRAPMGVLARLVLEAASSAADAAHFAALAAHPRARFGYDEKTWSRLGRLLDLTVWRGAANLWADAGQLIVAARERSADRHAHPNIRAIAAETWAELGEALARFQAALKPLQSMPRQASLSEWARAHLLALADVASADDASEQCDALNGALAEMRDRGQRLNDMGRDDYSAVLDETLADIPLRGRGARAPRPQILGLLEARLLPFDVAILAGLQEGVWPPAARVDPFLSRSMRASVGLSSPERRLGQTAHDFEQLCATRETCLVLVAKRDGAPALPSRFVARLAAVLGEERWRRLQGRGDYLQRYAAALDERAPVRIDQPRPRPPLRLRPKALNATRIEILRRDPYSIYAEYILRLVPLEQLVVERGAREIGIIIHDVMCTFAKRLNGQVMADATGEWLIDLARRELGAFFLAPGFAEFHWPQLAESLRAYWSWEQERGDRVVTRHVEVDGKMQLQLSDGSTFILGARADRIDEFKDGSVEILDFKTGRIPTAAEIKAGFAPQLVLEAAILAGGGFRRAASRDAAATYVKLGGRERFTTSGVGGAKAPLSALVDEQLAGLRQLIEQLRDETTAYPSRPYPRFARQYGAYDHLARVREWGLAGDEDMSA